MRTDAGDVECELVVNCAGMWARELAERNGVVVPNQAAEHYYLVTEPIEGMSPDAPVFEDPASYGYYREEGGGMMVGLFEPAAAAWKVDGIPRDFSFGEIPPDWDRMGPFVERAIARVPVVETVGIRTFFCGPESFTPDLAPAVGEAPGIHGYFVCAGLNSVGILSAGGLGRVVAHWIADGRPDVDVTGFDVARFRDWQLQPAPPRRAHRRDPRHGVRRAHPGHRARLCAWGVPLAGARPARRRGRPAARRQRVGVGRLVRRPRAGRAGRAGLGAPAVVRAAGRPSTGRCARRWGSWTCRSWPSSRCGDRMPAPCSTGSAPARSTQHDGVITYTQWLGDGGGILADLTVTRLAADDFLVVASDTAHGRALALLRQAVGDAAATVDDVTTDLALLTVQGPASRDTLAAVAPGRRLVDRGVPVPRGPPGRPRRRRRARHPDHLPRRARLGALRPGRPGARGVGCRARGGRGARHPPGRPAGPVEPADGEGLPRLRPRHRQHRRRVRGRASGSPWRSTSRAGSPAARPPAAAKERGTPHHRLVQVLLEDPEPLLFHAEPVLRDGVVVGYVRAASYGWTLGGAVGLAFVGRRRSR